MALIYHDKLSVQDVRCLFCSSASLGCTTLGIQAIHHATPEPKVSDVTCNMDLLCVLLLIGNIGPLVVSHHNNLSQYREERWYAVLRWYAFCQCYIRWLVSARTIHYAGKRVYAIDIIIALHGRLCVPSRCTQKSYFPDGKVFHTLIMLLLSIVGGHGLCRA